MAGYDTTNVDLLDQIRRRVAPPWRTSANCLCLGCDVGLFFPERGEDAHQAKAVCAECPVRLECLEWALDNRETFGIWGGCSERERRRLRRSKRPLRCDHCQGALPLTGRARRFCSRDCSVIWFNRHRQAG